MLEAIAKHLVTCQSGSTKLNRPGLLCRSHINEMLHALFNTRQSNHTAKSMTQNEQHPPSIIPQSNNFIIVSPFHI